jgi:hypothetical protein
LPELHVLRDVDDHRAWTAGSRDMESLVQDSRQFGDVLHQVVVLGAGPGDADGVAFLEGVGADQVGGDLAGDDDQRNGIHQGVDDAGDRVGGAGTRGDQDHSGLAGGACIAFSRMGGALLVADQDVLQLRLREERVINRQHRAARIAEQHLDALVEERAHDHFGAGDGVLLGFDRLMGGHGWGSGSGNKKGPLGAWCKRPCSG